MDYIKNLITYTESIDGHVLDHGNDYTFVAPEGRVWASDLHRTKRIHKDIDIYDLIRLSDCIMYGVTHLEPAEVIIGRAVKQNPGLEIQAIGLAAAAPHDTLYAINKDGHPVGALTLDMIQILYTNTKFVI